MESSLLQLKARIISVVRVACGSEHGMLPDEIGDMNNGHVERSEVVGSIVVEVAPADLLDRISVLEVKSERLIGQTAIQNVLTELAALRTARDNSIRLSPELIRLSAEIRGVNETLWDLEETVRRHEHSNDFGVEFVEASRAIIRTNDRRAALKRTINRLLGARFQEEKSYPLAEPGVDAKDRS